MSRFLGTQIKMAHNDDVNDEEPIKQRLVTLVTEVLNGDIFTFQEFVDAVDSGVFTDYDGHTGWVFIKPPSGQISLVANAWEMRWDIDAVIKTFNSAPFVDLLYVEWYNK